MHSQRIALALGTLAVVIAVGLLSGPTGFRIGEQAAEAALLREVQKLLASDAGALDQPAVTIQR